MKIKLDIARYCIETAVRRQYNKTLSRYFTTSNREERIEAALDILMQALEKFDFPRLRHAYPELEGHGDHEVILETDSQGQPVIRLDGECILD